MLAFVINRKLKEIKGLYNKNYEVLYSLSPYFILCDKYLSSLLKVNKIVIKLNISVILVNTVTVKYISE